MPSPQSKRSRSPPRRTRSDGAPRNAVGIEPDVPRKTRSRSTPQVWTAPSAARSVEPDPGHQRSYDGGSHPGRLPGGALRDDPRAGFDPPRTLSAGPRRLSCGSAPRSSRSGTRSVASCPASACWATPSVRTGRSWEDLVEREAEIAACDRAARPVRARRGRAFVLQLGAEARRRGFPVVLARSPAATARLRLFSRRRIQPSSRRGRGGAQPRRARAIRLDAVRLRRFTRGGAGKYRLSRCGSESRCEDKGRERWSGGLGRPRVCAAGDWSRLRQSRLRSASRSLWSPARPLRRGAARTRARRSGTTSAGIFRRHTTAPGPT